MRLNRSHTIGEFVIELRAPCVGWLERRHRRANQLVLMCLLVVVFLLCGVEGGQYESTTYVDLAGFYFPHNEYTVNMHYIYMNNI